MFLIKIWIRISCCLTDDKSTNVLTEDLPEAKLIQSQVEAVVCLGRCLMVLWWPHVPRNFRLQRFRLKQTIHSRGACSFDEHNWPHVRYLFTVSLIGNSAKKCEQFVEQHSQTQIWQRLGKWGNQPPWTLHCLVAHVSSNLPEECFCNNFFP